MSIEDLDWSSLADIKHVPVVDGVVGHETEAGLVEPFPEDDVLIHSGRLQLLFPL